MNRPGVPATAAVPEVERYLAEVAARLPGPATAHTAIVAELRSGLLDAADGHRAAGLAPVQAVQAAIGEFGIPALVAYGFRAEIAASHARRVSVALLATGPLVGLLWIATAAASHVAVRLGSLWQWTSRPAGLGTGIQLVAVAVAVTAWGALLGIAATGRLTRWVPASPRRAPTAAAVAGFGAVGADALGLALLAAQLVTTPGKLSPLPAAAATAAAPGCCSHSAPRAAAWPSARACPE
jgi:hypothetical protein